MAWLKGLIVAAVLAPAFAAQAQDIACRAPAKPMLRAELWFGRNIGGRLGVTERVWRQFVARELTPRFPDGLTVIEAQGQWRDSQRGTLVREPSKIVVVMTADDAPARERIAAVADVYKQRFKQDSVAVVTRPVCAAF
jgi:hypothetical protein